MKRPLRAFTLLEVLTVVVILAILAVIAFPVISHFRARAQRIQCSANLRNLYVAANLYVQDNGSWPQIRLTGRDETALAAYANDWIGALESFGATRKTWICPTNQELLHSPDYSTSENARSDYFATPFDDKPASPYQWPRQPWFVETGDVHGHGNLIIFTDGSISDLKSVIAGGR